MTNQNSTSIVIKLLYGVAGVATLAFIYTLVIPYTIEFVDVYFEEGVGLKTAAVISFFVSIGTVVLFAMVGGDGLLGEVQYMFAAFFSFWFVIWLLVAWIF
ncbi:hypothetical protein JHD48_02000 [Sulfurimonas sp. SAG-AH-194-I05]|nr:hypothetical protein [Sulfurimonas sp. SAG-AH-194-I05]MDF1874502.1 hypothetical protein [Sulfurimonas sp. SAG-AH-194-I05]